MPFIPHTPDDTEEMLAAIGAKSVDDLFDEIPADLKINSLDGLRDVVFIGTRANETQWRTVHGGAIPH